MKIGLIDADLLDNGTRHPNLALMKLSAYHKDVGNNTSLLTCYDYIDDYDKVYVSKVFSFTKTPNALLTNASVVVGGTGFYPDGGEPLPYEIEHFMPDYTLYDSYVEQKIRLGSSASRFNDYLNYSIGFTTRGCFRKCEYCVNRKYDSAFRHSPVKEFLNENKPYIFLWDDNVLAYSRKEEVLDELDEIGKPFQFRQGLDIRLINEGVAKRLANSKYHGDFIFAFDHIKDKVIIEKKIKLWKRYTNKTTKLYVLCAYDSQDISDIEATFERIKIIMNHGCLPYIMRYESYKLSAYRTFYTQLARWCNQPQFFKKKSFREFCTANQVYHRNPDTTCSAYQSMLDFEKKHPEISKRYFDLRFDQENEYDISYGYARKYTHKIDCDECEKEQLKWLDAFQGNICKDILLQKYFTKEMDLQCLTYRTIKCDDETKHSVAEWFSNLLLNTDLSEIFNSLIGVELENINPSNIPQFSKMGDAIHKVVDKISSSSLQGYTFEDMGYHLDGERKNAVAMTKYGENHSKFSALLDLAAITAPKNTYHIDLSVLGNYYCKLSKELQRELVARLAFRIPIVQHLLLNAHQKEVRITDFMHGLSNETKKRRKPNVVELIRFLKKYSKGGMLDIIDNIIEE